MYSLMSDAKSVTRKVLETATPDPVRDMALDTSLLYGLVAASAAFHALFAIVVGYFMMMMGSTNGLALKIGLCVFSFLLQFGLLAALQANTCSGIKDYGSVAKGAAISLVVVAAFAFLPPAVNGIRDIVAWVAPRASPATVEVARIVGQAGINAEAALGAIPDDKKPPVPDVYSTSLEEYTKNVFKATSKAVAFFTAFGGAYGIGLGSLVAAKCPANK